MRDLHSIGVRGVPGGRATVREEKTAQIIQMRSSGLSMNKIGKLLGITGPTVRAALQRCGAVESGEKFIARYDETVKKEAVRLYVEDLMSCAQVAKKLDLKCFTVKEWVNSAGVVRSMSEAASRSISAGRSRGRSSAHYLFQSRSGEWFVAESSYEYVRMQQVDCDPNVDMWSRCLDRIEYQCPRTGVIRRYHPDLDIRYVDGSRTVEEIKPSSMVGTDVNSAKISSAISFYKGKAAFRVVTELEIGLDALKAFSPDGTARLVREQQHERNLMMKRAARKRRMDRLSPEALAEYKSLDAQRARDYRANRRVR